MKILHYILFLSLLCPVLAADEPSQLLKLRKALEKSQAKELEKLNKIYLKELEKMKKNFMEAQNLQGALAVDREIKAALAQLPQKTGSPWDGVWLCKGTKTHTAVFKGDKMIFGDGAMGSVTFKNGTIHIEWDSGWWHKLTPDPNNENLWRGTNPHKKQFTYERLKW